MVSSASIMPLPGWVQNSGHSATSSVLASLGCRVVGVRSILLAAWLGLLLGWVWGSVVSGWGGVKIRVGVSRILDFYPGGDVSVEVHSKGRTNPGILSNSYCTLYRDIYFTCFFLLKVCINLYHMCENGGHGGHGC